MNFLDLLSDKPFTVHPDDWKMVSSLNLLKFNGIIAGGAALKWYQGQTVGEHDVDVFFKSLKDNLEFIKHLSSLNAHLDHSSNDADTFTLTVNNKIYKVQAIKTRFGNTPEEIINDFDISVAMIATEGERWYLGKDFSRDLKNKVLRFNKISPNALRRYIKYQTYGFEPEPGSWDKIANTPGLIWDFENHTGDYDAN